MNFNLDNAHRSINRKESTHELAEISSLADYISQIDKITAAEKSYLYRGQKNEDWQVNSSAYRRLEKQQAGPSDVPPDVLHLLWRYYLNQIINAIQLRYPSTYRDLHPLECMAHLQHNKVATG